MMTTILLFGLAAAAAEILGGAIIITKRVWPKRVQEILLALGAGFIIALALLKLIPTSIQAIGESAALYMMVGFGLIHFFEHTLAGHFHFGEETHPHVMTSRIASISAFVGLFIHAFFDGFSIFISMKFDFFLGVLMFFAVLLHKIPEGLTIGSIMLAGGYSRKTVLVSTVGIGMATMLGVSAMFVFPDADVTLLGSALALSAGATIYVGASDLIPEINKSENRLPPLFVFVGMLLFYLSERLLEGLMQ
jgi:zinc transporter ZupT